MAGYQIVYEVTRSTVLIRFIVKLDFMLEYSSIDLQHGNNFSLNKILVVLWLVMVARAFTRLT